MSEPLLHITVLGKAEPQGSKRAFINKKTGKLIVTDDNPKGDGWKSQIAMVAADALEAAGVSGLLEGALRVEFTFYRPRNAGDYGSGRNRHLVKDSAPAFPIVRPDALKLARAAEDALTGIVWRDDAQIVEEVLRKRYGAPARLEMRVWPMQAQRAIDLPMQERVRSAPLPSAGELQGTLIAA